MTQEKARDISSDLIKGDSCCARSQFLEEKINTFQAIIKGDSIQIHNLGLDVIGCNRQVDIYANKEDLLTERIDLALDQSRKFKRSRISWGIVGIGLGIIIGTIIVN